jgi:ABC-type polysaccharide/polyol phosphate transport system ATPase subunit
LDFNILSVSSISKRFPSKNYPLELCLGRILGCEFPKKSDFTALEDISFNINRGETVGLLGLNGSGKSTLLQIIAGTMTPSSGKVDIKGNVASILELGSGFDPNFTGIENIYLNASLHGLTTSNTDAILEGIIEFANIGEYIYQPVRTYSSGMVVRLAYSILANLQPELLLIDEALAVGDFIFQQKCIESMRKLQKTGTGILFVSHSINLITEFCTNVLVVHKGRQHFFGNIKEGVFLYEKILLEEKEKESKKYIQNNLPLQIDSKSSSLLNSIVQLLRITFHDENGEEIQTIETGKIVILKISILFKKKFNDPHCGFKIVDEFGKVFFGINTYSLNHYCGTVLPNSKVLFEFELNQKLQPGKYSISVGVANGGNGIQTINFNEPLGYFNTNYIFQIISNQSNKAWNGPVLIETNVHSLKSKHVC